MLSPLDPDTGIAHSAIIVNAKNATNFRPPKGLAKPAAQVRQASYEMFTKREPRASPTRDGQATKRDRIPL